MATQRFKDSSTGGGSMGSYPGQHRSGGAKRNRKGPNPNGGTYGNPQAIRQEHVLGVRHVLRQHGYEVDAKGALTDRLLSAWRNYRRGLKYGTGKGRGTGDSSQPGAHTTKEWNELNPRKYGAKSGALHKVMGSKPNRGDLDRVTEKANHVSKAHERAAVHAKMLGTGAKHKPGINVPGVGIGSGASVNKLLSQSYADKLAGMQFDPAIRAAQLAQAKGGADAAQHQRDIAGWGSQIKASQATATTRDQQAGAAARSDVSNLAQAIQNSLGGSRGAGVVGAAALNDQTALAGQGAAQDRYNADLAPILQAQSSDQSARQRALDSQSALQLASQLTDLQGQRGQAKSKAAMDILTANNAARQSNFGNRLALVNANLAAQAAGLDQLKTAAMIDQYGITNQINRAKLHAGQVAAKQASHPDWAVLDPGKRQQLVDNAIATAAGQLPPGIYDPTHIMNSALATIRAGGYASARKAGVKGVPSRKNQASILGLIQQRLSYYHGQHPAGGAAPVA